MGAGRSVSLLLYFYNYGLDRLLLFHVMLFEVGREKMKTLFTVFSLYVVGRCYVSIHVVRNTCGDSLCRCAQYSGLSVMMSSVGYVFCKLLQFLLQIFSCDALFTLGYFLGRSAANKVSTFVSAFRSEVYYIVGTLYQVHVVFYHNHAMAFVY